MIVDSQDAVSELLADASTYGRAGPVDVVETHISRVFMVADRVYKLKRAVVLPYADFSTPALRLATCRREVELNVRTAPEIYLGVRRVTREADGALALDGTGELVDAVVEMVRFDQSALLDRMAVAGTLTPAIMTAAARAIVSFHRDAPIARAGSGTENMAHVLAINEFGFAAGTVFATPEIAACTTRFRTALRHHSETLDRRGAAGKIRRCHGDLHLRNIFLLNGEPRLFDCIEFNDAIATVDILYDLAFLLMDLWHRGFPALAGLVTNRYLDEAPEDDGFALLPFFMAVRSAVRAHVVATQASTGGEAGERLAAEARSYFRLANDLLEQHPQRLVAIGGFSGSGKTTVAQALAPHVGAPPGARIVESDRVRKSLHGVSAETRLPQSAYAPEVSARVYREMARRAEAILAQGGSVVANAVFDRPDSRERIEKLASARAIPFTACWLHATPATLKQRVATRHAGPSDATPDVLEHQLQTPETAPAWPRLDASHPVDEIVAEILGSSAKNSGAAKI